MLQLLLADITKISADAIVNAANSSLLGGGGVDGAIHRAGGPEILEACKMIVAMQGEGEDGCNTGEAVITTAGKLPAKYVIHTVGPVWRGGKNNEPQLLANCYRNCLRLAAEYDLKSIAFPGISTGVYGYPKEAAAEIAIAEVTAFQKNSLEMKVLFVAFDEENHQLYQRLLEEKGLLFP